MRVFLVAILKNYRGAVAQSVERPLKGTGSLQHN